MAEPFNLLISVKEKGVTINPWVVDHSLVSDREEVQPLSLGIAGSAKEAVKDDALLKKICAHSD